VCVCVCVCSCVCVCFMRVGVCVMRVCEYMYVCVRERETTFYIVTHQQCF